MGNVRQTPDLTKHTYVEQNERLAVGFSSMCGWRLCMEDGHIIKTQLQNDNVSLFAIFDGHGGLEVAHFAMKHFLKQFQNNDAYDRKFDIQTALKETFLRMDEIMKSEAGQKQLKQISLQHNIPIKPQQQYFDCGSTALVLVLTPNYLYVANAGDSRAIASHKHNLLSLSTDHKPTLPLQHHRIKAAGGYIQQDRINGDLMMSRGLGDFRYKQAKDLPADRQILIALPQVLKLPNKDLQYIVMGCDGIWQRENSSAWVKQWIDRRMQGVKDKELGNVLSEMLDELVCQDKNVPYGRDNMSVIFIRIKKG